MGYRSDGNHYWFKTYVAKAVNNDLPVIVSSGKGDPDRLPLPGDWWQKTLICVRSSKLQSTRIMRDL